MERIEYLLNHPTAVEGSDLELLNNEIEKYPYFYSLRALKLSALKKIKDDSFENQLPLTATYSNDRKDLYQFINGKPITHSEIISKVIEPEAILPPNEEIISDSENIETVENNLVEDTPNPEVVAKDTVEIPEVEGKISLSENLEEVVDDENTTTETLAADLPLLEVEEPFADTLTEDIKKVDLNAESKEKEIEQTIDETIYEEIVKEPTIESLIEEIKLENISIPIDEELITFDFPQPTFEADVEKSVVIAEDLLLDKEVITAAVKETYEIQLPTPEKKEIEQVDLINRTNEFNSASIQHEEIRPVANLNVFQIQNTFDEVKGRINSTIYPISEVAPLLDEVQPIAIEPVEDLEPIVEVQSQIVAPIQPVINAAVENFLPENEPELEEENKSQSEPSSSLSFNEWLKRPMGETIDATTQKEIKYQIIDEFLEKNPKITPIKKQDIPESKIDVKEIKQTDYSDLMTETLAQIYIEQKQYEKAIRAYKILSLKYPEKNSLFANQIKEIENLKNSK